MSKLATATEIVKNAIEARETKNAVLDKLVAELSITRSNAFVYYTKATKALGLTISNGMSNKVTKAEKVAKAKVNPVTETSPAKAAAKIAEIDNVIAGLKAKAGTAESRATAFWAQLGA